MHVLCTHTWWLVPHRAADWKLDEPAWSGRLRITSKGKMAYIKMEDKISGQYRISLLVATAHVIVPHGKHKSVIGHFQRGTVPLFTWKRKKRLLCSIFILLVSNTVVELIPLLL